MMFLGNEIKQLYVGGNVTKTYVGDKQIFPSYKTVRIGEHDYPYVKIGNLYWLSEDLNEPVCTYYVEKDRLTYLISSVIVGNELISEDMRQLIPNGWRIPNVSDLQNLILACGDDDEYADRKELPTVSRFLRSKNGWNRPGDDVFGFNLTPTYIRKVDSPTIEFGGIFMTSSIYSTTTESYRGVASFLSVETMPDFANSSYYWANRKTFYLPIRLCTDTL